MTPADQYRIRAAELQAKVRHERNPRLRRQWMNLALAYLRLAEQAERNSQTDIVYEPAWYSKLGGLDGEPA
jgi:hypothetical protein